MDWKQEVLSLAQAGPGRASLLLADAETGAPILEWEADRRVVSASTIKVAILLCALSEVQHGCARLSEEIFVPEADVLEDSEVFDGGAQALPLDELLRWMIITSDNTATNALIRRFSMDRINAFCRERGWTDTRVERLMLDYAAVAAGKNNYTSARDQCAMFRGIYRQTLLTPELCTYALKVLLDQRCKDDFFRYIPFPVRAAHKTGSLADVDHDSGLFFLPGCPPFYLGVFVTDLPQEGAGRRTIGRIARRIYDEFHEPLENESK